MNEPQLIVTMKDMQRYHIIKDCLEKKISAKQGAFLLGISSVHFWRIKKKLLKYGLEGIFRPKRSSPRKLSSQKTNIIAALYREHYHDFNIMHFKDKLAQLHNINFCYESIRKILINYTIHKPKKKKLVHRRRRRMPKAGMLIQMDSSQHCWLEKISQPWWLIAMIDDATNEVPYAQFFPADSTFANMHVIRRFIELKGRFIALYVDKASHFRCPRHKNTPHYHNVKEQTFSQIDRALKELDINLINADSPQAKGRIERLFRFFQDRLIKELRLARVTAYSKANLFLNQSFLPWYNKKYSLIAESAFFPLPVLPMLDTVFCIKFQRLVNYDNTVQVFGQIIQIPPSNFRLSFAKTKVDICILENKRIAIVFNNKIIAISCLSKNSSLLKRFHDDKFLNQKILVSTT
ncbi:MAG: ISNCY family transposase [Candidatus Omnitrophota bacterium]